MPLQTSVRYVCYMNINHKIYYILYTCERCNISNISSSINYTTIRCYTQFFLRLTHDLLLLLTARDSHLPLTTALLTYWSMLLDCPCEIKVYAKRD